MRVVPYTQHPEVALSVGVPVPSALLDVRKELDLQNMFLGL